MRLVESWLLTTLCLCASWNVNAIWPTPSYISYGTPSKDEQTIQALRVDVDKLVIAHTGDLPADLIAAIERTKGRLKSDAMQPLIVGYGASRSEKVQQAPLLEKLKIILDGIEPPEAAVIPDEATSATPDEKAAEPVKTEGEADPHQHKQPAPAPEEAPQAENEEKRPEGENQTDTQASDTKEHPPPETRSAHQFPIEVFDAREASSGNTDVQSDPPTEAQVEAKKTDESLQADTPPKQSQSADRPADAGSTNATDTPVAARSGLAYEIQRDVELLDEAYSLTLPADGSPAVLRASSSLGILRGLTTFEQLFFSLPNAGETTRYVWNVPIDIHDKPAYPYRGIMVDTARNFIPIQALRRTIEAASFAKLNQFHWHIVDAQSFPLKLDGNLSVLAEKGAYSQVETYSAGDVRDFVQYAGEYGINVNVEIDMPGHTYEGVLQYKPELVACPNKHDWAFWANEPPSGQLALNNSAVNAYVKELIQETSKLLAGPYFGHGNDEVNLKCYGASSKRDIDASLLKPFIKGVQQAIVDSGKTPMVWEEAAIDFPETAKALVNGTIVEVWTSASNIAKVLESNPTVRVITAPYQAAYLDVGLGSWLGDSTGQSYADYVTWQMAYAFDPLTGTQGIPDARKRVLGGEMNLWTEQVDENNLDALLWPRALAGAEVYWTGDSWTQAFHAGNITSTFSAVGQDDATEGAEAAETNPDRRAIAWSQRSRSGSNLTKRSAVEALPRLHEQRYRLVGRGIQASPLQPKWCALRPNQCNAPIATST
ncbi:glycoside hydrolase family 20 protein [Ceraceosorus bombacis]|uniref:beta-N-acetylhexosaminidase n=1 Tax=Ceraceosorus bombacis TaxID=401625 RepID=A0A0P1BA87_9BASI|nr:glycoside hydrolase family 20 protein [Ceraceosorus bombacis]